jgi:hypothetical protein
MDLDVSAAFFFVIKKNFTKKSRKYLTKRMFSVILAAGVSGED